MNRRIVGNALVQQQPAIQPAQTRQFPRPRARLYLVRLQMRDEPRQVFMFCGSEQAVRLLQIFRALQQIAPVGLAGQRSKPLLDAKIRQIPLNQLQVVPIEIVMALHALPRL